MAVPKTRVHIFSQKKTKSPKVYCASPAIRASVCQVSSCGRCTVGWTARRWSW